MGNSSTCTAALDVRSKDQLGATGVMQEWQKFVANQQRLGNDAAEAGLHRPAGVHDHAGPGAGRHPERRGFSDAVFSVASAFLSDDRGRFVAEVELLEQPCRRE